MKFILSTALALMCAAPLAAQTIEYGDDSGEYANDNECDDPRFIGWGVATSTTDENILRDASDCQHLTEIGLIRPNHTQEKATPAECGITVFGNNSSEWANNSICDDPRFSGPQAAGIMNFEDVGRDASDCQSLCESGGVWLR